MCLLGGARLDITEDIVFCADPRLPSSFTLISVPGEVIIDKEPVLILTGAGNILDGRVCSSLPFVEEPLGGGELVPCLVDGRLETGTQLKGKKRL